MGTLQVFQNNIVCSRARSVNTSASAAASPSSTSADEGTTDSDDGVIFPVTGHRLFYGEYGEPQSVLRKERSTIDQIKKGQVSLSFFFNLNESRQTKVPVSLCHALSSFLHLLICYGCLGSGKDDCSSSESSRHQHDPGDLRNKAEATSSGARKRRRRRHRSFRTR